MSIKNIAPQYIFRYCSRMSKENRTFRIGAELIERLEKQARMEGRSMSNLVRGYLEDRVELADQWPAFDGGTREKVRKTLSGNKE